MEQDNLTVDVGRLVETCTTAILEYHIDIVKGGNTELRDAAIVKMTALVSLAFDMAPTSEAPLDVDDTISKLRCAMHVLATGRDRPKS
jgi:hypothetical protein